MPCLDMPLKCNCLDQINLMFADWYLPPPLSQAIPCKFHHLINASNTSPNSLTHRLMYILNILSVHSTPLSVSPSPYSLPQVPSVQTTSNISLSCLWDIEGVKGMLFQKYPTWADWLFQAEVPQETATSEMVPGLYLPAYNKSFTFLWGESLSYITWERSCTTSNIACNKDK